MPSVLETLVVEISADASDYKKNLGEASGTLSGFAAQTQKIGGAAILGLAGAATAGGAALAAMFVSGIGEAREAQAIQNQLAAVIKSTGGAAGMTVNSINELASTLQKTTNFEDDAIVSGENMLLTFTNIGSDVFPAATETMLNMSAALGTDLKGSAIQLGKALNDPIKGVGALSRVGVSFTEEQKAMIASMVEAGDVAGAQGVILDELGREFGGAAAAVADPVIQLQNTWGNFKETLGAGVLPILNNLAATALPFLQTAMEKIGTAFGSFFEYINSGYAVLGAIKLALYDAFGDNAIVANISELLGTIGYLKDAFLGLFSAQEVFEDAPAWLVAIADAEDVIRPILKTIGEAITKFVSWQDVLVAVGIAIASVAIPAIVSMVVAAAPLIAVAVALVAGVALLRHAWETDWGGIREKTQSVIEFVTGLVEGAITLFQGTVAAISALALAWNSDFSGIQSATHDAIGSIQGAWPGFVDGLKTKWEGFTSWVGGATSGALDAVKGFFESHKGAVEGIVTGQWAAVQSATQIGSDAIGGIVSAGAQFWQGDWQGGLDTLKSTGETVWGEIQGLFQGQLDALQSLFDFFGWTEIGENIMSGIVDGIENGAQWIVDAAENAAQDALDAAKSWLGIGSPSTVAAAEIGAPFSQGIALGASRAMARTTAQIQGALDGLMGDVSLTPAGVGAGTGGGMVINVYVNGAGGYETGRQTGQGIADELRRRGLSVR